MVSIDVVPEYGYVLAVGVAMYLVQQLVFVIPVVKARVRTGIKAPTLYPRDSEIKKLGLKDDAVAQYYSAQRAHQNNVEFTSAFMAPYLVAGLFKDITLHVAYAGAAIVFFRLLGGLAYSGVLPFKRGIGGFFHIPELYVVYLAGRQAYLLTNA